MTYWLNEYENESDLFHFSMYLILFQNSRRISDTNLDKRDLLIYLLWEIGYFTNQQIGDIFKLTYSSVSRRVNKFRNRIKKENSLLKLYKATRSQIKV